MDEAVRSWVFKNCKGFDFGRFSGDLLPREHKASARSATGGTKSLQGSSNARDLMCEIMVGMLKTGNQMKVTGIADAVGIDFGTTNSSVALVTGDAQIELASFLSGGARRRLFAPCFISSS